MPPDQPHGPGSMTIPQLRTALMHTDASDQRAPLITQVCQLQNAGLWDDPIPPLHHTPGRCGLCGQLPAQCGHQDQ